MAFKWSKLEQPNRWCGLSKSFLLHLWKSEKCWYVRVIPDIFGGPVLIDGMGANLTVEEAQAEVRKRIRGRLFTLERESAAE